jgi:hypothetical protein
MLKAFHRLPLLLRCPLAGRDGVLTKAIRTAFEALNKGNGIPGLILCRFEVGWHGGNFFNAVNHAHRHNQKLNKEEKRERQERFGVQLNLGPEPGSLDCHGRFCSESS